ncbi:MULTISPECIES: hypothetical protein [Rhodopseudomonas]|uniref:Uncharacterized protein n=1 Tax=Rhodopseudomonas palustris TaxID=1076 RepID=A0A0D7ELG1_RHOPL|nr:MULTISPECIES: hypothetical protein [Rhodopseudomonas]KIZ41486.1 hypothetical protein OO17_14890 [Rhodopseudomonas palustris]MDF3812650.1 hypothetical protein [Rhodopseudomonas sp. BAL398]WOK20606.1 hypothetical protein RBJ75_05155 [Rhodopseudomonas sp. BAL398]
MTLPKNVMWFEALLYMSLMLDSLSVAFQDRTPTEDLPAHVFAIANLLAAGLILLLVYLVQLAAQRRKSWPRGVLVASLVFSVVSLMQIIGQTGLQANMLVDVVSCGLTGAGLYLSFTGDARGWFNE